MDVVVVTEYEGAQSLTFYCDGCACGHTIEIAGKNPARQWQWDGNREKPTISPSVLCWLEHRADEDEEEKKYVDSRRCHSFIRGGMMEFLSDCGHKLAGTTVALHPMPEGYGVVGNIV